MRELTQIDSPAEHACAAPLERVERWNVLEPVSGRWFWLLVFSCCSRVAEEPEVDDEEIQKAA
jgi:hypothetical protein